MKILAGAGRLPSSDAMAFVMDGTIYPHLFQSRELSKMQHLSAAVGGNSQVAGGLTPLSKWEELERYLILGDSNGTYYAGEPKLSTESAGAVRECLAADGARAVNAIVELARSGRVPRQDALLFALAMAASPKYADAGSNAAAPDALPNVAPTAAHLKHSCTFGT